MWLTWLIMKRVAISIILPITNSDWSLKNTTHYECDCDWEWKIMIDFPRLGKGRKYCYYTNERIIHCGASDRSRSFFTATNVAAQSLVNQQPLEYFKNTFTKHHDWPDATRCTYGLSCSKGRNGIQSIIPSVSHRSNGGVAVAVAPSPPPPLSLLTSLSAR